MAWLHDSIERELHFLLDSLCGDYWANMINKALEVDEQFLLKNKEEQMCFILSSSILMGPVIMCVYKMLSRRKQFIRR